MKNLSQIPRKITSKFCWQKSGLNENYLDEPAKIESKKVSSIPAINKDKWKLIENSRDKVKENSKIELAELKELLETKKLLAENNIRNNLNTESVSGLTEELNHNKDASLDLKSEEFNYNDAMKETDSLLAQLDSVMKSGRFGPMNV